MPGPDEQGIADPPPARAIPPPITSTNHPIQIAPWAITTAHRGPVRGGHVYPVRETRILCPATGLDPV